jgi:hypothetical protein
MDGGCIYAASAKVYTGGTSHQAVCDCDRRTQREMFGGTGSKRSRLLLLQSGTRTLRTDTRSTVLYCTVALYLYAWHASPRPLLPDF